MLFTRASEYALLASIYLASQDEPRDVEHIASKLDISKTFLAKVLQCLARDGILNSYKGVNGGFELAKKPSEITLSDILNSAEKRKTLVYRCSDGNCPNDRADSCKAWPVFNILQNKMDDFLSTLSLEDILKS